MGSMACDHLLATSDGCDVCAAETAPDPRYTQEAAGEYKRQLDRYHGKRSLAEFFKRSWHVLEPSTPLAWNWHIPAICDHLQAIFEDWQKGRRDEHFSARCKNFLINVPPGTAKSRITSVTFPAWAWLHDPSWRVLCLSKNPRVALRDARFMRELVLSDWYQRTFQPDWAFKEDQAAAGDFANTKGGVRMSAGLTANVVGDRADGIIADDPNDPKDAHSEANIFAVNDRWGSAVRNRVNDYERSFRIVIQQRIHEDDLTGNLLSKGGYNHLCLPMEYGEAQCKCPDCTKGETFLGFKDPRTEPLESLHEKRFPVKVIQEERVGLGPLQAPGQLNQTPTPAGGGMFKNHWWSWHRPEGRGNYGNTPRPFKCNDIEAIVCPKLAWQIISVDADFKDTGDKGSQACIGILGGGRDARRYVLHVEVCQGILATIEVIKRCVDRVPRGSAIFIEDKANGPAVIEMLQGEIAGVIAISPEGGKEARAAAMVPTIAAGDIYLADGAPWIEYLIGEHASFPLGKRNDSVDMLSQAIHKMAEGSDLHKFRMLATM